MFQFLRRARRHAGDRKCCERGAKAANARRRTLRHETLENRNMLALLGVAPLSLPTIAYNSNGIVAYDSTSDSYSLNATPLSIDTISGTGLFFSGSLSINANVDSAGSLIGGVPGDDFVLVGDVDVDGDFVTDYTGTLLTGEILGFGSQDSGGTTDQYDFRFSITGGLMAGLYAGKDLGVTTSSENSTFVGDFNVDFGGNAKGTIGAIDQQIPQLGSLSGTKYTDVTGDGISGDDTPLAGVTVNLYQDAGAIGILDGEAVYATTMTNGSGDYSFADLPAGNYIVEEVVPVGYVPQTPIFYALSIAAGQHVDTGYDFANSELGSISGTKLAEVTECECDQYGNTTQTIVTQALEGVTINLYLDNGTTAGVLDGDDDLVDSTTTDVNGNYLFDGLAPGAYIVEEIVQSGYVAITPAVVVANVTSGADLDRDFNNKLVKASVGNYFFIDSNSNGLQDTGDLGVNGVTVKLLDQSGNTIATTETASDGSGNAGYYLFYDLAAGNYAIQFVVPVGVQFTIKDVNSNGDNTLDSDANSNGRTDLFSLSTNQHRRDIDAGVLPEVCIESVVYKVKDYFDKCQQSKAGTIKGVTLEYNDGTDELFVQVTIGSYYGRIAEGFTIVIDNGGDIDGARADTFAVFYFDATSATPVLNVLGYNGQSDGSSIRDSNGRTSSYDPDRIATSLDNSSGWVKELSVTGTSTKKVFTFRVDVAAINDHVPLRDIDWQGSEIGRYASFVVDTYAGLTTRYDESGFLTKWAFCYHGWMDACHIRTQKCVVTECIAIDEFFAEWGWTTSAFTGNSDGDPLADILWAGSKDACNTCEVDSDPCGDYGDDWWDNCFNDFGWKLGSRC